MRTPSNVFVINLAFCDFVMMTKTPIFIYNSFNHGYALGEAGCQVFALMGALSGIGAAMTNAWIAYDRFGKFTKTKKNKNNLQLNFQMVHFHFQISCNYESVGR